MSELARTRLEKRYAALVRKRGACAACIHRERERDEGWAHCRNSERRQHPRCSEDNKGPTFTLDVEVIKEIGEGSEAN